LSIVHGPFSAAPCRTLASRFANFCIAVRTWQFSMSQKTATGIALSLPMSPLRVLRVGSVDVVPFAAWTHAWAPQLSSVRRCKSCDS
jgi:hypothetical protein